MAIELRWVAGSSASCWHAAAAVAAGRTLAIPAVAEGLRPAIDELVEELNLAGISPGRFFEHLAPLACTIENNHELARAALTKTRGNVNTELTQQRVAGALTAVESAYRQLAPHSVDELALRGEPLRQQWEARGPGLWTRLAGVLEPDFLCERADVFLVQPVLGGAGVAHIPYNAVRIEAVLTNPDERLPEIVRLTWLLAQLNLDLPVYQGMLTRDRVALVGAWALIPAVLRAAEDVELARGDDDSVRHALGVWRPVGADEARVEDVLHRWWITYEQSRPRWAVALAALDQMLAAAS